MADSDKPQDESTDSPETTDAAQDEQAVAVEDKPEDEAVDAADTEGEDGDDEEKPEQTVTVEDLSSVRKRLTIELPQSRIEDLIGDNYEKLQDEAVIPGFRRGRAPKRLIEKRFGSSIRDEVKGQLIGEAYQQAIDDESIDVVGRPEILDEEDIELPEEGPFTFKVEIEVVPAFDLPELDGLDVNRKAFTMTDEDVNTEIDRACRQQGDFDDVADGKVEQGDYLAGDVRVTGQPTGDEEEDEVKDGVVEIVHHPTAFIYVPEKSEDGKGHVTGIVIPDMVKQFVGKSIGDEVKIEMTGPAGHEDDRIKDKPITIAVRIDKIERMTKSSPEELAESYGMESVDDLRDTVRRIVEDQKLREQRLDMHEQVTTYLMGKVEFDLPENMTNDQTARLLHRSAMDMAYRGASQEEIEQSVAEMREQTADDAKTGLKQYFILEKAAKQLDIDVTQNELNGRIAMMAVQQGRRPEKLRQEMFRSGQIDQLYVYLRDQKTLDQIIDNANVTDVDADGKAVKDDEPKAEKSESEPKKKKSSKKKAAAKKDDQGDDDKGDD